MSASDQVNNAIIHCEKVCKRFTEGGLNVDVLKEVSIQVAKREMIAIVGASGSGKSTLLHILGGLDYPTSGSIFVNQQNLSQLTEKKRGRLRNQYLGFIYQFHHLMTEFNALENVCMPLLIGGMSTADAKEKAAAMIDKVGLTPRIQHRVGEMSGGERQRIAIARALVSEPACVLADEPTGNLDNTTAGQVFDLMLSLNESLSTSFIMVTHDLDLARKMHRTLHLSDGVLSGA